MDEEEQGSSVSPSHQLKLTAEFGSGILAVRVKDPVLASTVPTVRTAA